MVVKTVCLAISIAFFILGIVLIIRNKVIGGLRPPSGRYGTGTWEYDTLNGYSVLFFSAVFLLGYIFSASRKDDKY